MIWHAILDRNKIGREWETQERKERQKLEREIKERLEEADRWKIGGWIMDGI